MKLIKSLVELELNMAYLGDDDPFNLVADAIETKTKEPLRRLRRGYASK
jgi:hypothetical protein